MTRLWHLPPGQPLPEADADALARMIRNGKILAFPTDTVYGLGASALNPEAMRRIYEVKGRDYGKPLPIFVESPREVRRWGLWTETAERLAAAHWPGALTLVLDPTEDGRRLLSPGAETLAFRVPDHPVLLGLLRASAVPWAATSANASGDEALTDGEEVAATFRGRVDAVLVSGRCPGRASTVVDARTDAVSVLREGAIKL